MTTRSRSPGVARRRARSSSSCPSPMPRTQPGGGDAPYATIVNDVPYDMEDYWTQLYPQITEGEAWKPLKGLEPFDPMSPRRVAVSPSRDTGCSTASQTITSDGTTSTPCRRSISAGR